MGGIPLQAFYLKKTGSTSFILKGIKVNQNVLVTINVFKFMDKWLFPDLSLKVKARI